MGWSLAACVLLCDPRYISEPQFPHLDIRVMTLISKPLAARNLVSQLARQ